MRGPRKREKIHRSQAKGKRKNELFGSVEVRTGAEVGASVLKLSIE